MARGLTRFVLCMGYGYQYMSGERSCKLTLNYQLNRLKAVVLYEH